MIADYHSLTTSLSHEHSKAVYNFHIGQDTFNIAKTLLACGVDINKTTLFVQSHVSAHTELSWILSCISPQHLLNTMIQYK